MDEQTTRVTIAAFMFVVLIIGSIAMCRARSSTYRTHGYLAIFAIAAVGIFFAVGLYRTPPFIVQVSTQQTQSQLDALTPVSILPTTIISPVVKSPSTIIPRATNTIASRERGQSEFATVQTTQPLATPTSFEEGFITPLPMETGFARDLAIPTPSSVSTSQRLDISKDKLHLFAIDDWNSVLLYQMYTTGDSDGEISSGAWSPLPGNRAILFSSNSWTWVATKSSTLIYSQSGKLESKFIVNEQSEIILEKTNPSYKVSNSVLSNQALLLISDAIWSPDGQRIVASVREQDGNQCPVIMKQNGTDIRRLPNCEADDHPRYWSVDGKWVVVWSERSPALYAYEVNGTRRVSLAQLGKIMVYDERYSPWRETATPVCKGVPSFWSCE